MSDEYIPAPGGRPREQHPYGGAPLSDWVPRGHLRRQLTPEIRVAIREAFAAAREDDPKATKMGFARENADKFGVSGASVIRVLTD